MTPNYQASIDFLKRWRAGGPWVLTAISLDKKSISTKTFKSEEEVLKWLAEFGSSRNIYFSVNSTMYEVSRKPMREDVASLDWLHVDIDPRAGEPLDVERTRILKQLREPPTNIPKPTVIVFSGGGYQGFWKLVEPKDIKGEETLYEDAKRYNLALELAFGADSCHNVDRIMRLPGTINRPDKRKKEKGRTEALAEVIEWDENCIYPLSTFTPAPAVQADIKGFGVTKQVKVSGNIKRIDDINDLGPNVSDLCKVIIVQGDDPDRPMGSADARFAREKRSGALFFVCCELVRASIDDDTIYSIITDPDFRISSSVLDKGRNSERYAIRQIERAREAAIHPRLRELNDRYAVVTIGGKQRIIYEEWDELLERHRLVTMTFEDFSKKYMHKRVSVGQDAQGNDRYMPLGKWWLSHEKRRQYEKVTFAPGREVEDAYNMWRGYAIEPLPGDNHSSFLDHILHNVCDGNRSFYEYVIGWLARSVQHPDQPGETAIVLRGEQGVGKGFLARTFGKLFGRHFVHVSNAMHLTGNFNAHLRDCVVLFCDEAFYAGDKRHASTLKTLVTEDSIMVTPKGIDTEMKANCLHIIMASNDEWVVPAGPMERRFCVLDVGDRNMQDGKYFGRIAEDMRTGGFSHLLYFLMTYDLSDYNMRALPKTRALRDQKVHSFGPMQDWWFDKLQNGKLLTEHEDWVREILVEQLIADYVEYARTFNIQTKRGSATKLGMFLKQACPGELEKKQRSQSATIGDKTICRPYYYVLPSLQELRVWWDDKFGGPYDWPEIKMDEGLGRDEEKNLPF